MMQSKSQGKQNDQELSQSFPEFFSFPKYLEREQDSEFETT